VLSPNVRVNSYSEIENSILFSHVNVGRSCRIRKSHHRPRRAYPSDIGYDADADRERYFVTDSGITVVTRITPCSRTGDGGLLRVSSRAGLRR